MSVEEERWDFLAGTAGRAVKVLGEKASHAEAFYVGSQRTEVTIRDSEVLTQNRIDDYGVGFRVAVEGEKVGFACTNTLSEKAILAAGETAFRIARVSSRVPGFTLPKGDMPLKVKGLSDTSIGEVTVEKAVEVAERAIRAAESEDKRVIAKDGKVSYESERVGVVNTLGVDLEEDRTWAYVYLGATGEHQGEVTPSCYDVMVTRKLPLQPERVGGKVAEDVARLFKPQPVESFEGTVIFAPEATSYQLVDVMLDALKGENVMAERSPWTRKVGHRVASEELTVKDDALLKGGFLSRAFDDEGCPSKETPLIRAGELVGFLHDATTANALGVENTGNASRSPGGFELVHSIIGTGYRAKPEVYSSNFTITPGHRTTEELVSEVERGVLVESMAGFPQSGSGMVSAQLSRAFYIEAGEVKHPIKGGMVTGVAFNWLKNISAVSSESKAYFKGVVPSLLVENVQIVSS